MIRLKITAALIVIASFSSFGQIKTGSNISNTIANENPFLDLSDYSEYPNNIGKGLVFPRTDLTTWTFKTDNLDGITFPTAFDGMIVYNTGTGSTVAGQGQQVTVSPGFYYFSNPGATDNVTNGQWLKFEAGNVSGGKFVDGTDPNDAVYASGNVGIGTTIPESILHINATDDLRGITLVSEDSDVSYTGMRLYRVANGFVGHNSIIASLAQGTFSSPITAINSQDAISLVGRGYASGQYRNLGGIAIRTGSYFDDSVYSGAISFRVNNDSGVSSERLVIDGRTGFLGINVGQSAVGAQLDIKTLGNTNSSRALSIKNSSDTQMLTLLDDGKFGLGISGSSIPSFASVHIKTPGQFIFENTEQVGYFNNIVYSSSQWFHSPRLALRRAGGTTDNRLAISNNQELGKVSMHGHDGSTSNSYSANGDSFIAAMSTENHGIGKHGSNLLFATTPNTTQGALVRLSIGHNGDVKIGNNGTQTSLIPATTKLDVDGYVKLGNADATGDATPVAGMMRYNSTTDKFQGYVNDTGSGSPGWVDLH